MMKNCKRLMAGLLAICMMMGLSLSIHGEQTVQPQPKRYPSIEQVNVQWVNPLYDNYEKESSKDDWTISTEYTAPLLYSTGKEPEYASDIKVAAASLRDQMKARKETAVVYLRMEKFDNSVSGLLFNYALEHTQVPTEGDYLRWQTGGYQCNMRILNDGTYDYVTFTYQIDYYTNAQQESKMDTAVAKLLDELIADSMTDYEKVSAIYDWMCDNITYDYANLENDAYKLKHSAYAALINRTSVCQGYAVLLYRLLLEVGIDCRVVTGLGNGGGHAWNIIRLDGKYYHADSTWDAGLPTGMTYGYFLKGDGFYSDHTPQMTQEFYKAYPVSAADYVPPAAPHVHEYAATVIPSTCTAQGYTLHKCACGDSYKDSYTQKLPHHFGKWVETVAPGVDTVGEERRECTDCHTVEKREIPATGVIRIKGDIDGDGKVSQKDVLALRQYICGLTTDVVKASLDVNGDGKVNMRDVARLAQSLSGLSVELH